MSTLDTTEYESSSLQGTYASTDTFKGIQYGPGCLETALPRFLDLMGAKKALIVTNKSLAAPKTDVIKRVEEALAKRDAFGGLFWEIGEHAPIAGIRAAVNLFKESHADVIVSVGGGSPIDASKAILYYVQQEQGGPTPKQIAIPTTLSAAEYTIGAGFTNVQGEKAAVSSQELAPAAVILDAQLTLSTPERLWLSTGIKALDHAIEHLYRPLTPPPLKYMCYAAIQELFKYLPLTKANPQDVAVRQKLQIASWMSLWPRKPERYSALGLSHSIGHKIGAAYGIPHGITSCLTLAPVIAYMAENASDEDKEWLSGALFYLRKPSSGSKEEDILTLSVTVQELVKSLGLTHTLSEYKVPKEDIPQIAEKSLGRANDPHHSRVVELLEALF